MVVINPDTSIKYVNPALENLTGFTAAEVAGRGMPYPWWPKEYREEISAELKRDVHTGVRGLEKLFQKKSGELFWVMLSSEPVMYNGTSKYLLANMLDITERKRAEEKLRESEEFNSSLMKSSAVPILVFNDDTSIRYVNPTFEKLTGFTADEIIGQTAPYPWWLKEAASGNIDEIKRAVHTGVQRLEKLFQKKNRERFWVEITLAPVIRDGKFQYSLANWLDITERKKMEEELREDEEFSTSLLENAPNPIFAVNPDSSIRYVNPALEKLTGFTSAEIIGKTPPYPWWPDKLKESYTIALKEGLAGHDKEAVDRIFQKKNGESFWVAVRSAPVMYAGTLKYYLINWLDITEPKKMEHALAESEEFSTSLLENAPNPILVVNPDTSIRYANPAFEKLTGCTSEEVVDKMVPYTWWVEKEPVHVNEFKKDIRTGVRGLKRPFQKKNGDQFSVEITSAPVKRDGKFQYNIENWVNITEREQIEKALQESEEKYRAIFEQAADSIVLIDPETLEIVNFNDRAYENMGYSREEFAKLKVTDIDATDSAEKIRRDNKEARTKGTGIFERKHRTKSGEIRDFQISTELLTLVRES